jgi:hypothetical protein
MLERRRRRLLIDRPVQIALLVRAASYWALCLLVVGTMLVLWEVFTGPPNRTTNVLTAAIDRYFPAMLCSLMLLPLVLCDVLKLSHRFVGPVWRMRQGLRQLADGKRPETMRFRKDDFWPEMAAEFNAVAERVEGTHEAMVESRMSGSLS